MKKIKRFFKRIKKVIDWLPIIWNTYDWDHSSATDVFAYQLERLAKFLESNNAYSARGKQDAQRIRLCLRLMKKVYNEDYASEWQEKIEKIYGKSKLGLRKIPNSTNYELEVKWENNYTPAQITAIESHQSQLMKESWKKQAKAHRILWQLIERNIQNWWD